MPTQGGYIALIVFVVVFIILFAVFLGLYIVARNKLNNCLLTTGATGCPPCPNPTGLGQPNVALSGAAPNEQLILQCPVGRKIVAYQLYTGVVDDGLNSTPQNVSGLISPLGLNSFSDYGANILDRGGIPGECRRSGRGGGIPSRVLFSNYWCG